MDYLSKMEEMLLIAIWQLQDNAYGYRIRQHILKTIGMEFSYGNLYSALNQLEKKGYVDKEIDNRTDAGRGKQKAFYSVTTEGKKALGESKAVHELLWSNTTGLDYNVK